MALPWQFIGETIDFDTTNHHGTFFHEDGQPKIGRVLFNFKCRGFYNVWQPTPINSSSSMLQFQEQIVLPIKETFLQINKDQFPQIGSLIDDHLQEWPILVKSSRLILILFALDMAVKALQSRADGFNSVTIDIPVKVVQDFIIWQPMEMDEVHMRPAEEGAIDEYLKGTVVMEAMNCVVCLEEMESGTQGKEMPCSHVFHEDCITQWLRTSHYCPICRFQLPTASDSGTAY